MSGIVLKPDVRRSFDPAPKTERVGFRISATQKDEIVEAAESVGTTLSDYLLGLHRYAVEKKSDDAGS